MNSVPEELFLKNGINLVFSFKKNNKMLKIPLTQEFKYKAKQETWHNKDH